MTKGRDEVKAAVDAVVLDVLAVQAALVPEVLLKLLIDVVGDRLPAKAETRQDVQPLGNGTVDAFLNPQARFADQHVPLGVVDSVAESWCVHDGELEFDSFLFYIHRVLGDFNRLCDSLCKQDKQQRWFWLVTGKQSQTAAAAVA